MTGEARYEVLRSGGVVCCRIAEGTHIDGALAQVLTQAVREARGGKPAPLLVDLGRTMDIDRQARLHFQAALHSDTSALAFVVKGLVSRIVADFFIGLSRPAIPTQVFESEVEAREWLQTS